MFVRGLRLTNVRSRGDLSVSLGPGLTILAGPNGAGKTTVLEAATLVLRGSMLRPGTIRDLIKKGEDHLRVEVELARSAGAEMSEPAPASEIGGAGELSPEVPGSRAAAAPASVTAASAYARDGERRLTADGAPLEDASRWRDVVPLRTFVPDDLRLIKGSPRRRRVYLDGLCERCRPEYAAVLGQYEEALGQRNMLLRTMRYGGEGEQFAPWEMILARTGLAVVEGRATTLASFVGSFQQTYARLTGEPPESLRLVYRTNVADLDESGYRERLRGMRGPDQQRTYTHLGPHRDDLRPLRKGLDMRDCASQGEQRAALLSLVLAEWGNACAAGPQPLLLLDDVMSELDEGRRRTLIALVSGGGQAVITTTDLRYFTPEELSNATVVELPAA